MNQWCDQAAYNTRRCAPHLVGGSIAAGPGAIPLTAIIMGLRNAVDPAASLVDSGHSCWFRLEAIGLGNVEPFDFAEIIAPVG